MELFTTRFIVAIAATVFSCCLSASAVPPPFAELPEVQLTAAFGMGRAEFIASNPTATPFGMLGSPDKNRASSFFVDLPSGGLQRVMVRDDQVAGCSVTWAPKLPEESLLRAKDLLDVMTKKFGTPQKHSLAKRAPEGLIKNVGLEFNLDSFFPGVVAILEASSVEVALHYLWTQKLPVDVFLKPVQSMLSSKARIAEGGRDFLSEVMTSP